MHSSENWFRSLTVYELLLKQIYIYTPRGSKSIPCLHREPQDDTANLSRQHHDSWAGESLGRGKWFWWMTFRVRPLATANSLPVPTGLMPPICRSERNEWMALCEINGPFLSDIYKWILLLKPNPCICFMSRGGDSPVLLLKIVRMSSAQQRCWFRKMHQVQHFSDHAYLLLVWGWVSMSLGLKPKGWRRQRHF